MISSQLMYRSPAISASYNLRAQGLLKQRAIP